MKSLFYLIITSFAIAGCDFLFNELDSPENSYDYSINQQMNCYCPQGGEWVKLFITADTVSGAIHLPDNQPLVYEEYKYYKSIKGLKDLISETDTTKYNLTVQLDSVYQYPAYVYLEPKPVVINDTTVIHIADGDLAYTTNSYIDK
jgi:hypothetical protein